ncbi:MAG: hypothetical protein IJ681_04385 [Bacteroidales bacterium]|nr:hypothetical protein [Bacteroidales bacterium]
MNVVTKILNGTFLQKITGKNLLFLSFCVLLLVIYIGFRFTCEHTIRDINKLAAEITALQEKSLKTKTIYQNTISMQQLNERLAPRGIAISKEEVKDIIIIE